MKFKQVLIAFAAGSMMTAMATSFVSQDVADMPDMEKAWMEAMAKYGTPSEEHKVLAKRAGKWNAEMKYWYAPGTEPQTNEGQCMNTMIMDGRYLYQEFSADMDGMPFQGGGVVGYDRIKQEFVSTWIDNMGTGLSVSRGQAKGDTIEYGGQMPDALAGKYVQNKMIEKMIDANTIVFEMHTPSPTGELFKSMEITYRRVTE